MHKRLESYSAKQCSVFLTNYNLALSSSDADALHDLRVAIKRIRAVFMLLEKMFPKQFDIPEVEGNLRELFKLSGRMRDAQVQQLLVTTFEQNLNCSLTEYQNYLKKTEKKAISKFKMYLKGYHPEHDLEVIQNIVIALMASTDRDPVRQNIIQLVDELMITVRKMQTDQEHDELLHEIRRKLKLCTYLLSIFRKTDAALPKLKETMKVLDTANDLLGDWHDRFVAMNTLDHFVEKQKEKGFPGENRYRLFRESLANERHLLHNKIRGLFESDLKI